jgi:hypothetical protein
LNYYFSFAILMCMRCEFCFHNRYRMKNTCSKLRFVPIHLCYTCTILFPILFFIYIHFYFSSNEVDIVQQKGCFKTCIHVPVYFRIDNNLIFQSLNNKYSYKYYKNLNEDMFLKLIENSKLLYANISTCMNIV